MNGRITWRALWHKAIFGPRGVIRSRECGYQLMLGKRRRHERPIWLMRDRCDDI